jgi:hypothetical protein
MPLRLEHRRDFPRAAQDGLLLGDRHVGAVLAAGIEARFVVLVPTKALVAVAAGGERGEEDGPLDEANPLVFDPQVGRPFTLRQHREVFRHERRIPSPAESL